MKCSCRAFDPSFKLEVVNTIKNQGLSVSQVAKDMNLTESTVRRGDQQVGEELAGRSGKGLPLTPEPCAEVSVN
ncbi:MAG: transposase [Rhodocyclales bacterium]|nr:transposase [Rhodocyclales bacterium]